MIAQNPLKPRENAPSPSQSLQPLSLPQEVQLVTVQHVQPSWAEEQRVRTLELSKCHSRVGGCCISPLAASPRFTSVQEEESTHGMT